MAFVVSNFLVQLQVRLRDLVGGIIFAPKRPILINGGVIPFPSTPTKFLATRTRRFCPNCCRELRRGAVFCGSKLWELRFVCSVFVNSRRCVVLFPKTFDVLTNARVHL